ncbi:MAG: L-threonylcarbamoyladenylate synthase [Pseudomonadota bacterium]
MQPNIQKATREGIAKAATVLLEGGLAAFPTETVYGLGADATNARAVARVFEMKGRPTFNPLIAHVPSLVAATELIDLSPAMLRLAETLWPGPLTLVAQQRPKTGISDLATAGLLTLAVRVPSNAPAHTLLTRVGRPIVAPSANTSGRPSPTQAAHVATDFADRELFILDDGPCPVGVESTIVGSSEDGQLMLLRPGAVPSDIIEQISGQPIRRPDHLDKSAKAAPTAPGQLASHYAPEATLRLNATHRNPDELLIAFGPISGTLAEPGDVITLSPSGDLTEAATNLFEVLRAIDKTGFTRAAVMPIPNTGLGEAINDRLTRAAAPRS